MKKIVIIGALLLSLTLRAQDTDRIDALLVEGDFDSALKEVESLLSTANAQENFLLNVRKAEALVRAGRFETAAQVIAAIEPNASTAEQHALMQSALGFLYLNQGRNDLALENLQESLQHWERAGKLKSLAAATTQSYLGNLFISTGRYAQAEEQLTVALITRQNLLPANHELLAASLNDLGLLFSFSDGEKALTYYEQALSIYEKLHGKNHPKIAIANTNIAYMYSRIELYGDAINNFEAALATWTSVYRDPHPSRAFVLFSLGRTYSAMDDKKTARSYYLKALEHYHQCHTGKHPDIARVNNALGNLEQSENRTTSALQYYQQAIISNHPTFNTAELRANPTANEFHDGTTLLYSLLYKAQALEQNYFGKTLRFGDLLDALRTLQTCDTLISRLRHQIQNESDKITLGGISSEVYTDGVRIAVHAADAALRKKPYRELAFYFAEKSKAAVLLGAISDSHAKSFAGIPETLLEEELRLKAAIAQVTQKLAQMPAKDEEMLLRQNYYDLNRTYASFTAKLESDFPAYYNLKYNSTAPTIAQLQQKLNPSALLLSYFIDEKNSRVYIFKVGQRGLDIVSRALPQRFDRFLLGLRNSLFYSELETYRQSAEALSAVLLPSINAGTEELVIIPDSKLGTIPFETLFTAKAAPSSTFTDFPYVVRKYAVRYEFSAGLILQKAGSKRRNRSILLCAPVHFASVSNMPDLPGTATEVQEISSLFTSRKLETELLLEKTADESNLKSHDLKKYSLLHFATHGIVDEVHPELSRIYLNQGNTGEDGRLYAGEIYNLQLDADLVTLSACQTGLGKIAKGEGVVGLSRALVFAGARNCMVSFWSVSDESTSLLMRAYYERMLASGSDYATVLKEVKNDFIDNKKYASPFYWAPFILIGF